MKRAERIEKLRLLAEDCLTDGRSIDLECLADRATDLYADQAHAAVRNAIRSDLRSADADGIPWALSVDNHGTYMQTSLMDVAEFRFAIRGYMKRSRAERDRAYGLAHKCLQLHGVWIDPEEAAA